MGSNLLCLNLLLVCGVGTGRDVSSFECVLCL